MDWRRSRPEGLWADPKDHGDLLGGHLNLFDQRPNNLTAQVPVGIGQSSPHVGCELVKPTNEQLEVVSSGRLLGFLLEALLQGGKALAREARLELLLADKAFSRAVNQAAKPLAELGQLRGSGAALGLGAAFLQRRG